MKKYSGFTLLELVIVIMIVSIVGIFASRLMNTGFSAYLAGKQSIDTDWQGKIALEWMTRDLRAIRSSSAITTATATQLVFVDTDNTTIDYQLSGTNLLRNSQIVADGIGSLAFTYYTSAGVATTTASAIRYINIQLNITKNNANYNLVTAVNPRNVS